MIPYDAKTATEHRQRWQAAVAHEWDFSDVPAGDIPEGRDRPGIHPDNVFDFHDGLRLIISTDKYAFGTYLHVSASVRPESSVYAKLKRWHSSQARHWFLDLVQERVRLISGREVKIGYVTEVKGVPHFFDPPLGASA